MEEERILTVTDDPETCRIHDKAVRIMSYLAQGTSLSVCNISLRNYQCQKIPPGFRSIREHLHLRIFEYWTQRRLFMGQ